MHVPNLLVCCSAKVTGIWYLPLYNSLQFSVVFPSGSIVFISCNIQTKERKESFNSKPLVSRALHFQH